MLSAFLTRVFPDSWPRHCNYASGSHIISLDKGFLRLCQKFRDAFDTVEKASLIDQGWHLFPGSERPPAIMDRLADDGQVNTEVEEYNLSRCHTRDIATG